MLAEAKIKKKRKKVMLLVMMMMIVPHIRLVNVYRHVIATIIIIIIEVNQSMINCDSVRK